MSQLSQSNALAAANLGALSQNPYPGRGLILGVTQDEEHIVQVYWIMGRSENSRNRVFVAYGSKLSTAPADPSKVKDPSLIIYDAMVEGDDHYAVSNGAQTSQVITGLMLTERQISLIDLLDAWTYEPDAPNFTPRITCLYRYTNEGSHLFEIVVLRKAADGEDSELGEKDVLAFTYLRDGGLSDLAGLGYCVTTYAGDGNPLPPFRGEPILLPLVGSIDQIANTYWTALNPDNRVSLAVKFIPVEGGDSIVRVINRFTEVSQPTA